MSANGIANEREALADERERIADERERVADVSELQANNVLDGSPYRAAERTERVGQGVQRQHAAAGREQAEVDRQIAASEREQAKLEAGSAPREPTSEGERRPPPVR